DREVHRAMVAMTPYLRSQLLIKNVSGGVGQLHEHVDAERLPYVLLSTFVVARLAKLAGMANVTFQTVTRLFLEYRQLIMLLAHVDRVMAWREGEVIDLLLPSEGRPFQRNYLRIAKALLPGTQNAAKRDIASVLFEYNCWDGVDRVMFLDLVAKRLE